MFLINNKAVMLGLSTANSGANSKYCPFGNAKRMDAYLKKLKLAIEGLKIPTKRTFQLDKILYEDKISMIKLFCDGIRPYESLYDSFSEVYLRLSGVLNFLLDPNRLNSKPEEKLQKNFTSQFALLVSVLGICVCELKLDIIEQTHTCESGERISKICHGIFPIIENAFNNLPFETFKLEIGDFIGRVEELKETLGKNSIFVQQLLDDLLGSLKLIISPTSKVISCFPVARILKLV